MIQGRSQQRFHIVCCLTESIISRLIDLIWRTNNPSFLSLSLSPLLSSIASFPVGFLVFISLSSFLFFSFRFICIQSIDDLTLDKYVEIFKRSLTQVPNVTAEFLEENEEKLQLLHLHSLLSSTPTAIPTPTSTSIATPVSTTSTSSSSPSIPIPTSEQPKGEGDPPEKQPNGMHQSSSSSPSPSSSSSPSPSSSPFPSTPTLSSLNNINSGTVARSSSSNNNNIGSITSSPSATSWSLKGKSLVIRLDIPTELNTITLKLINFFVLYNKRYVVNLSSLPHSIQSNLIFALTDPSMITYELTTQ